MRDEAVLAAALLLAASPVLAQEPDFSAVEVGTTRLTDSIYMLEVAQPAYAPSGLPKITFSRSMSFYLNGETIDVFHRGAAHTDGDAVIYFRTSNVVHTGDVFGRYGFPFIDEPNGGSIDGLIRTIDYVAGITDSDTRFIPGHGQLSTRDDLLAYGSILRTIRDRDQALINQGRSLEEVIASNPTGGYEQRGFMSTAQFIRTVHDSLRRRE